MIKKKGQATFYIILVVIIALVVAIYITLSSTNEVSTEANDNAVKFEGADAINSFVESCMQEMTYSGILKMGLQGGYIRMPEKYLSTIYADVPYYYYNGDDLSPTIEDMQNELAYYINHNIDDCIYNFNAFKDKGFIIETGKRSTTVTIGDKEVIVNLNYPVTIVKDSDRKSFEKFTYKKAIRLKDIYDIAQNIMVKVYEDPNSIDQTNLLDLMQKYNLQIDTLTSSGGIVTYVIDDNKSILWPNTNLMFLFATKTDMTKKKPVIDMDDVYYASVGEKFLLPIYATDENDDTLEYYSDSETIGIGTYSGMISFTPKEEDIGAHRVEISVFDGTFTVSKIITIMVRS